MQNISIDNTLLIPHLNKGWAISKTDESAELDNVAQNKRFEINDATHQIVQLCNGKNNLSEVINQLVEQYPEASSDIQTDVETVIQELQMNDVIGFKLHEAEQTIFPIPEKTPAHGKHKLCIGMATYDDYDGVYFSIQAIRMYHDDILDNVEFVVIDNHPDGPCSAALKALGSWIKHYRYVPCNNFRGTAVRDVIFREANADYILCMDSHVFMAPGSIKKLLAYFDAHPNCNDFLQGPLINDNLKTLSSHFKSVWNEGMYGTWGNDERAGDIDGEPFEIPMQGLGVFCCSKDSWPGFNPRFAGFGGEEGYIHEKFRQTGGRTLCLPFLRWLHRFNRPLGTRYVVSWEDRIRNYMIGLDENQLSTGQMIAHFKEHIGEKNAQDIVAKCQAELQSPLYQFDAIYCLQDDATLRSTHILASHHILRRLKYHEKLTSDNADFSADHAAILKEALAYSFSSILILNSISDLPTAFAEESVATIKALKNTHWHSCAFKVSDEQHLDETNIAAIAYQSDTYELFLQRYSGEGNIQDSIEEISLVIDI